MAHVLTVFTKVGKNWRKCKAGFDLLSRKSVARLAQISHRQAYIQLNLKFLSIVYGEKNFFWVMGCFRGKMFMHIK